jgi:hypothetical protein
MKGSVYKRCRCPVVRNSKGQRLACKKDHGSWYYEIDRGPGVQGRRAKDKRGGYRTRGEAQAASVRRGARSTTAPTPTTAERL